MMLEHKSTRHKGMVLLMALAMIFSLTCVLMVCAFALKPEANQDERHAITLQRMLKVKRALIGRLADTGGGIDISSCGGFISDYGEPNNTSTFEVNDLLGNTSGFTAWEYAPTHFFWTGYRGERYLGANAEDSSGPIFIDGWGNVILVSFNGNRVDIESWGKDRMAGSVNPGSYDEDILESFYWRRPQVDMVVTNTSGGAVNLNLELIYPWQGDVQSEIQSHSFAVDETCTFTYTDTAHGGNGIPVGLRKLTISEGGGTVKDIIMLCIPPGGGTYTINCDYPG